MRLQCLSFDPVVFVSGVFTRSHIRPTQGSKREVELLGAGRARDRQNLATAIERTCEVSIPVSAACTVVAEIVVSTAMTGQSYGVGNLTGASVVFRIC